MLFTLSFHLIGDEHSVTADSTARGITVTTPAGANTHRGLTQAIHAATNYAGDYLRDADRKGQPWGIKVSVADVTARYGAWNLGGLVRVPIGPPAPSDSPVAQIHARYRADGPMSALANAEQILRAYLTRAA